jgi:predicted kinase
MGFKSARQRKWFFANQGSSGSGGEKSSSYKPGTDPVKTLYKQDKKAMAKAVKEGNKTIAEDKKDEKEIKKWKEKADNSKINNFNVKTGKYNPERVKLHNKLIKRVDNPNAIAKDGKKPKVIFIGGLTASGKSTAIKDLVKRTPGQPDHKAYPEFIYLNSDDFKTWLPEYKGYNANYVHNESNDLLKKSVDKYSNQKKQIIYDATLRRTKDSKETMDYFKKKGYEVVLYGTNLPGEKSIERATSRFKGTKRYVPLELIEKNAEPTNKSVLKLRHKADKYAIIDTNVAWGEKPKLIESDASLKQDRKEDAKEIVDNEKEWRDKGVSKVDLEGYDTKDHKKVKVKIK